MLRESIKIPVLSRPRRQPSAMAETKYLHEAQTTISLTGFDERNWTAIGLIDSPDEAESVKYYHSLKDGRFRPDPIAKGDIPLDRSVKNNPLDRLKKSRTLPDSPVQNPRLYFLKV